MNQHDESSSTDVVDTPGEADEEDGSYMVDNLLLEVLKRRKHDGRAVLSMLGEGNCWEYIFVCCMFKVGLCTWW